MDTLYPKLITDALSQVRYPGNGKSLVENDMIEDDIRIDGRKVSFTLIFEKENDPFIRSVVKAAEAVRSLGMGLNAGHDLSLENLKYMHDCIPWLDEVSIGHALVCDALYLGLEKTIQEYRNCLK